MKEGETVADSTGDMTATRGSRPVPDPTELTDRAIARLEKSLTAYIDGKFETIDERLRGIDTATSLRLDQVKTIHDDIANDIQRAVVAHERIDDEKFRAIEQQFKERDTRSERESRDNKVAVDAAFAAQKEAAAKQDEANAKAIDKSERSTAETIKTNQELGKGTTDTLTKDVDALKLAVNAIQAGGVGRQEQKDDSAGNRVAVYTTVGLVVSLIIAAIAIIGLILKLGGG
jgi:hypothetical protein